MIMLSVKQKLRTLTDWFPQQDYVGCSLDCRFIWSTYADNCQPRIKLDKESVCRLWWRFKIVVDIREEGLSRLGFLHFVIWNVFTSPTFLLALSSKSPSMQLRFLSSTFANQLFCVTKFLSHNDSAKEITLKTYRRQHSPLKTWQIQFLENRKKGFAHCKVELSMSNTYKETKRILSKLTVSDCFSFNM
jgi:hypothetical protein